MRVIATLAALAAMTLLAGCDSSPDREDAPSADFSSREAAAAFAATGSPFDYRYAYRLPGDVLKATLESNADGCDRLGPDRCRILAMRYRVENATKVSAVLTVRIDPALARAYGDAVTEAVAGAGGELVNTEVASGEASARGVSVMEQLQEALDAAEAQNGDGGTPAADTRAERIRQAIATIREVQGPDGQSLATAPVLITYQSSSALSPIGTNPEASFRTAGETLERSLAGMVQLLAGVGPWLVLMIIVVFALRWAIHGRGDATGADPVPNAVPVREPDPEENRNLIQRWFARDDDEDDR